MKRSLAYGCFPGFFSHNAAEGHYFTRPELYDRDRPLFRKYVPLCKLVAEALAGNRSPRLVPATSTSISTSATRARAIDDLQLLQPTAPEHDSHAEHEGTSDQPRACPRQGIRGRAARRRLLWTPRTWPFSR